MASITKRGRSWRAQVRRKGLVRSQDFATRAAAVAWATQIEADYNAGRAGLPTSHTFGQALDKYRLEVSPKKRGARWEELRLKRFAAEAIAKIPLSGLTSADIAEWRDKRLAEVSGPTVAREMNLLRAALEVARKEWRWIQQNPMRDVSRPPGSRPRQRRVSDAEAQAIVERLGWEEGAPIDTQQKRVAAAFLLALETGMRAGEILSLTESTVFPSERFVRLLDTKNGDRRDVPLSKRAAAILTALSPVDGRYFPVSPATLDVLFRRARDAAKIIDLTFHDSRHEACTRLARRLSVLELARMIGHRDPRSLMIYFNATASELAERLD